MENKMFVRVQEVCSDLSVSRSTAYMIIKRLNTKLEEKGYLTITGMVSRKYYIERLCGYEEYLAKMRRSAARLSKSGIAFVVSRKGDITSMFGRMCGKI
ncbi:hypothetical protein [Baileyella intestinalis]|uniref:hypothetical protein n=1 Tax=Baileyella intestinalis TaxID=2606709 RepID=UPI0022E9109A|nr:hypothetical protein [Baileyella intestinalis]